MATYCWTIVAVLLLSGIVHLAAPRLTERCLSRPPIIRWTGALLVLLSMPCMLWRGWYFWLLFLGLLASGLWRLLFPHHSIRAQQRSYSRRVHGCLLIVGALVIWATMP